MSGTSYVTNAKPNVLLGASPSAQAHYERCLAEGTSPKLAEMFALGQPPMSNSDREFLEGHCNGNQFEKTPYLGNHYRRVAERMGQDTKGKVYKAGLARFPGDPEAWVNSRDDVRKLCEQRGWDCDGAVTVNAREKKGVQGVDVADDLLEEEVQSLIEDAPEPLKESRVELKEKVRAKRKPRWKPRSE